MRLVLVGGGDIRKEETKQIDSFIINQVRDPVVLFIAIAAGDHEGYISSFQQYYASLGCKVIVSKFSEENKEKICNKISQANIIYFSGGDPKKLMDAIIEKNIREDLIGFEGVIVGYSAGAMVLGHQFNNYEKEITESDDLELYAGLNFVSNTVIEPHFENKNRLLHLEKTMGKNDAAIGINDASAYCLFEDREIVLGKEVEHNAKIRIIRNE
jgi:peptidase E